MKKSLPAYKVSQTYESCGLQNTIYNPHFGGSVFEVQASTKIKSYPCIKCMRWHTLSTSLRLDSTLKVHFDVAFLVVHMQQVRICKHKSP